MIYLVRVCTYLYSLYQSTWPTTHAHTHALCCLLTVVLDSSWSHNFAFTAIPAFGFKGHFTAAVSRGPAPGRSRGWRGPAFDWSYSCARLLQSYSRWLFSAFFNLTNGRRLAFACFPFFFDHFDWQKLFSNQKKRPSKRSSRLSGRLLVEFFQSEKQR